MNSSTFKYVLVLGSFLGLSPNLHAQFQDAVVDNGSQSRSSLNIGLGFSYNRGGGFYGGGVPYGMHPGFYNACTIVGGGWNNGGFGPRPPFATPPFAPPAMPPIPPPAPIVPPHIAMGNMGWGPGFGSFPGPRIPGYNYGVNCIPCVAGIAPPVMGPVPGGPGLGVGLGINHGSGLGLGFGPGGMGFGQMGGMGMVAHGERSEIADITWATAFGLSNLTTNVYPVAFPRWGWSGVPTPYWSQTGERDSGFLDRNTHGAQ